jgi:hypothetical protein
MPAAGIGLGDVLAGSGYAHRDAEAWVILLRQAGRSPSTTCTRTTATQKARCNPAAAGIGRRSKSPPMCIRARAGRGAAKGGDCQVQDKPAEEFTDLPCAQGQADARP